ncbi:MAG: biotin/lipoyl-containing protein [Thermoanaerobaculia bacterium]
MELIVRIDGVERRVVVERGTDGHRLSVDGEQRSVGWVPAVGGVRSLVLDGRQRDVSVRSLGHGRYRVTAASGEHVVEVLDPLAHLARQAHEESTGSGAQTVTAYMPGRVVAVLVEEGATVERGQGVVVLEAMKMENEIQAESAGVVRTLHVAPGEAVDGGDPLFDLVAP